MWVGVILDSSHDQIGLVWMNSKVGKSLGRAHYIVPHKVKSSSMDRIRIQIIRTWSDGHWGSTLDCFIHTVIGEMGEVDDVAKHYGGCTTIFVYFGTCIPLAAEDIFTIRCVNDG